MLTDPALQNFCEDCLFFTRLTMIRAFCMHNFFYSFATSLVSQITHFLFYGEFIVALALTVIHYLLGFVVLLCFKIESIRLRGSQFVPCI